MIELLTTLGPYVLGLVAAAIAVQRTRTENEAKNDAALRDALSKAEQRADAERVGRLAAERREASLALELARLRGDVSTGRAPALPKERKDPTR